MAASRFRHVPVDGKAKWMKHASAEELSELVNLMLVANRHTKALVMRRQVIRDRCYARARRSQKEA